MRLWLGIGAIIGALVYAFAGALMAARNLRWFGLSPDANSLFLWLGLGLALMVLAFAVVHGDQIWRQGSAGRVAAVCGIGAPAIWLTSRLIDFAIFGTLFTFIAILAFAVVVHRGKLLPRPDVVVLYAAALASITWNTETASAALLVFVGMAGAWISYRALVAHRWRRDVGANG